MQNSVQNSVVNSVNNVEMGNQIAGGNGNKNRVSFDSNIKVVELDTKIRDGFLYSGSKKLNPFNNL
jgi:hypothetical protein